MILRSPAVAANTDRRWFDYFRPTDELRVLDEVNFWRPAAQTEFRALKPGEPLFLRLKSPDNAIAGFGFFAVSSLVSVPLAWEIFGDKNGDPSAEREIPTFWYGPPGAWWTLSVRE